MAATVRCAGCGHMLPSDARLCLRCGRSIAAADVELERIDAGRRVDSSAHVVVERRGPGRPSRTLLSAGGVVAALALAIALLSGGSGGRNGRGGDETATPTTAVFPPSTPSAEATTVPSTGNAMPSTSVTQLGPVAAPVLGRATGGLSLYAVTGRSLARVELDTGSSTIASLAIPERGGQSNALGVYDGRLLIARDLDLYAAPLDLSSVAALARENVELLVGRPNVVVREIDPRNGRYAVRQLHGDGHVLQEWSPTSAPPTAEWTPGMLGDRLLVMNAGRIYTVGRDGARQYAVGDHLASNEGWVLWRGCNEVMVCRVYLGDAADPQRVTTTLEPSQTIASQWGPLIAPDGATMVVRGDADATVLMRTDDGTILAKVDFSTRPAWTPDGEWIFTRSGGATIVAISTRDGTQRSFPLRGIFGTGTMVLTVG